MTKSLTITELISVSRTATGYSVLFVLLFCLIRGTTTRSSSYYIISCLELVNSSRSRETAIFPLASRRVHGVGTGSGALIASEVTRVAKLAQVALVERVTRC